MPDFKRLFHRFETKLVIAVVLLTALSSSLFASADPASYTWEEVPVAFTQKWKSLASDASGSNLIAGTDSGLLLLSHDSGTAWVTSTIGALGKKWRAVASSADGNHLVATSYGQEINVSHDGGNTWSSPSNPSYGNWSAATISDDGQNIAVAYVGYNIFVSTDGGVNWTDSDPDPDNSGKTWTSLTATNDGSTIIAVADYDRTYISHDAGITWTVIYPAGSAVNRNWSSVSMSDNGSVILAASYNQFFPGRLYLSTNSGTSWAEAGPFIGTNKKWWSVNVNSSGTKFVAALETGETYYATYVDNTTSAWSEITPTASPRAETITTINGDGSTIMTASENDEIYSTSDNGTTWETMSPAGAGLVPRPWSAVGTNATGSKIIIARSSNGVYRSDDFGTHWEKINIANLGDNLSIRAIASNLSGSKWLISDSSNGTYMSTDGGTNWEFITSETFDRIIFRGDENRIYGLSSQGLRYSSDGGFDWASATNPTTSYWGNIAVSGDGTHILMSQSWGRLFLSEDSGNTWREVQPSGAPEDSSWYALGLNTDGSKLVAGGYGRAYLSDDGGAHWYEQPIGESPDEWANAEMSDDGSRIVLANTKGDIFATVDGGVTWDHPVSASTYEGTFGPDWNQFDSATAATPDNSLVIVAGFATQEDNSFLPGGRVHIARLPNPNQAPTASAIAPLFSNAGSGLVMVETTVYDNENDQTSLYVDYSIDGGATWVSSTIAEVAGNGSFTTSTGMISGIGNTQSGNTLTILFNSKQANIATTSAFMMRVTPYDGTDFGSPVTSESITIDNVGPAAPSNPTFSVTTSSITISWDAVADADHYFVYNLEDFSTYGIGDRSFTINDLTPNTSYSFQLRAADAYSNLSELSPVYSATTTAVSNTTNNSGNSGGSGGGSSGNSSGGSSSGGGGGGGYAFYPDLPKVVATPDIVERHGRVISLAFGVSSVKELAIAEDSNYSKSSWQPYSSPLQYTLTSESVGKIYIKFRAQGGGESNTFVLNVPTQTTINATENTRVTPAIKPEEEKKKPAASRNLLLHTPLTSNLTIGKNITLKYSYKNADARPKSVLMVRSIIDPKGKEVLRSTAIAQLKPRQTFSRTKIQQLPKSFSPGTYTLKLQALELPTQKIIDETSTPLKLVK